MKKLIVLLTVMALFLSGCAVQPIAETDSSGYFTQTILPLLINYAAVVVGVLSALAPILRKINRSRQTFDAASSALDKNEAARKKLTEEMKALKETTEARVLALETELKDAMLSANAALEKLLEIERLAYLTNPALVADGTAKKIAEVLHEAKD